jgi:acyl-coenzyme A synthetase/AMP-(fatty) acid ligase
MLKPSGIWVSPAEVEARLLAHEAVVQAVVVAAADTDGLERLVAFVILLPGQSVTEAQLIEFCRQGMPSVKRPRKVVFTDAYPTTATGKVRRVELRELAAAALVPGGGSGPVMSVAEPVGPAAIDVSKPNIAHLRRPRRRR